MLRRRVPILNDKQLQGDIDAVDTKADGAAKTATTYITAIDNNGIRVHPSSTQNNSAVINANGMEVFKGGTDSAHSVAFYGDTTRIGKEASSHVFIDTDSIAIRDGLTELASFATSGIKIGQSNRYNSIFSANSVGFYSGTNPIATLKAGYEDFNGYSMYCTSLKTSSYTGYTKPTLRLSALSSTYENCLDLVANDAGDVYENYAQIRVRGEADEVLEYGQPAVKIYTDNFLNVGHGYTGSSHGFELSASTGKSLGEVEASVEANLSPLDNTGQLLMSFGSEREYTEIRFEVDTAGTKGDIYHTCRRLYSNVALTVTSDKRLKEHEAYLGSDAVKFMRALKPSRYIKDGKEHLGFYAQDVEAVNEWQADLTPDIEEYKGLTYTELIAPLVAYCQALDARINELEKAR